MPKVLTQQQIDQYHDVGYISPIDVMSEGKAANYLQKLESAEREHPNEINAQNR